MNLSKEPIGILVTLLATKSREQERNGSYLFGAGCVQRTCMILITRGVGPGSKFLDFRLFVGLGFFRA
jgi:hypothetical protein